MRKIIPAALALALVATAVQAQPRGGPPGGGPPPGDGPDGPPAASQVALDKIWLSGVVLAIDPAAERVTIAYDAAPALGWPAGAMPFAMAKPGLIGDLQPKQKVRFRLDSHRIAEFRPVPAPGSEPGPGDAPDGQPQGAPPQGSRPPGGPPPR